MVISEANANKVTPEVVEQLLGKPKFREQMAIESNQIGLACGLAWTEVGGEVLFTEATLMDGKGQLIMTGKLGEVMQESAGRRCLSCAAAQRCSALIGTSIARWICTSTSRKAPSPRTGRRQELPWQPPLCLLLTRIPVRNDVAMTGEITLRGKVLPIGGVKEKLLAAHRAGIKEVILPKENEKDLQDIPQDILESIKVNLVETMDEVLQIALERLPLLKDR